ncbi:hypothetical protein IAU60_005875 [Kwoniella sp. DSM 27419]
MPATFLGLDASTQSLKASLLSETLDVVSECSIHFDTDLAEFKTRGGVLFGDDGEVFSPVMMLVKAMDLLFDKIKQRGWDVGSIRGVSAAGQLLADVDPQQPLSDQLAGAFSRQVVPNWQDSSTSAECAQFEAAVGGQTALARMTGSRGYERFTGPQILRFKKLQPEAYSQTSRISLVSSAVTTLLCLDGEVKGIDESDACGMNLWDIQQRQWAKPLLELIGGDVEAKLGKVETDAGRVVGQIGRWFVTRYGFSPECCVFPGTGDNPATFLSLSHVVLVSTSNYHPSPEFHAFYHPARSHVESPRYFNMVVYKSESPHVRDLYYDKSWDQFNAAVERLRAKTVEDLPSSAAFWWLLPDIVYTSDPTVGVFEAASAKRVDTFPEVATEALAILESQLFNYRSRSSSILEDSDTPYQPSTVNIPESLPRLTRVYATGGASANKTIISLMADVLAANVCKKVEYEEGQWKDADWNACSVGVAYKARWGWERAQGREISFDDLVHECARARAAARTDKTTIDLEEEGVRVVASPGEGARAYERRVEWWRLMEQRALADMKAKA